MTKIVFIIALLILPSFGYAQSLGCPHSTPEYIINFSQAPLKEVDDLLSADIVKLSQTEFNSHGHLLGMFSPKWSYNRSGEFSEERNSPTGQSCYYLKTLTIHIEFIPTLYLSREAQMMTCTRERVGVHERKHYQYHLMAFNALKKNIGSIITPYYDNLPIVYNHDQGQFNSYIQAQDAKAFQAIQDYMNQISEPFNEALDTPENYTLESKQCSEQENQQISRLFDFSHPLR